MTLGEVVVLMALGALLVAGVASSFRVPPLAIFVAACMPSAYVLVIAELEASEPCERAGIGGVSGAVAEIAVVLALVLWGQRRLPASSRASSSRRPDATMPRSHATSAVRSQARSEPGSSSSPSFRRRFTASTDVYDRGCARS